MFLVCHPVSLLWDKTIVGGRCADIVAAYQIVSGLNLLLDVIIILLPMPILWNLQMPASKKLAISAIFGFGIIICLVTAFRMVATSQ